MSKSRMRLQKNPHKHSCFGTESLTLFFTFVQSDIFIQSSKSVIFYMANDIVNFMGPFYFLLLIFIKCQFFKKNGLKREEKNNK